MVQPDIALFGKKDYQQLLVIRRMVEDLEMPVRIEGVETVREPDGLAMSSRNGYLTEAERAVAPALYETLRATAAELAQGANDFAALESDGTTALNERGLRTDYLAIRTADDLETPKPGEQRLVVLAAAYLGRARLIDNIEVTR
jgi:pantoate--beta-alanine ligase